MITRTDPMISYGIIVKEMSDSTVTYVSKLGEKYIIPRDGVYFNDNECALDVKGIGD